MTRLDWQHTEFGRRTADGRFHIVRSGAGWRVLDAEWNNVGPPCDSVPAAQQLAERLSMRERQRRNEGSET